MPFVQAKCPNCGGMLAVDNSKKAAICQFCEDAFIVEEAINNYNIYNTINNTYNNDNRSTHNYGEGTVVNVYEDKTKDFIIKGGVLERYEGAPVDVVIPDGVIEIGAGCFKGLRIKSVVIPDSVVSIDYEAFAHCVNLTSVIVPDNVTNIDETAFENTPYYSERYAGKDFVIEEGVLKEYKGDSADITIPIEATTIGEGAFRGNKKLKTVVINSGVKCIGESAFYDCSNLTSITLPDCVTNIGEYAFWDCVSLESIIIPNSVTNIGYSAFCGCKNLVSIVIPKSVRSIGDYAFHDCTKLISVTILNDDVNIGEAAFQDYWKSKGLCPVCGGTIKKGFLFNKCSKCGF